MTEAKAKKALKQGVRVKVNGITEGKITGIEEHKEGIRYRVFLSTAYSGTAQWYPAEALELR